MEIEIQKGVQPKQLYVDGQWRDSASGESFETINPATGEVLATVACASAADVDTAVSAARQAFEGGPWTKMSASDRGKLLWRIGDRLEERLEEFATLETLDNGKPIFETSYIDVPQAVECFRYFAGWATKIQGETIPVRGNYLNYTIHEPLGVCGLIVPWNFPLLLSVWKIAPALAAGNSVILKPSIETPLTVLKLAELFDELEVPPGVFNVIPGKGSDVGAALVEHAGVDKISFTGSTSTGREIMKHAAGTLKRISLELGGKSPNIVFADADLSEASKGARLGIFYNQGEICSAGSRLFVQGAVHDQCLDALLEVTKPLKQGDPLDPKTRMGAQISEAQLDKILQYIETGKGEGANLVCGGRRLETDGNKGFFVEPTIFDQVSPEMTIAQEEIFGPVLSILTFEDEDELVEIANSTIYGLVSAVWTRDVARAHRVARRLKAGTVWINCYNMFDAASPFGGYKMSGFGRELSEHALAEYTQVKSVWVNLS